MTWMTHAFDKKESAKADVVDTEDLSGSYTTEMQEQMEDDSLVYRHDRGMNYAYLADDIIVGSCLQTPVDVDKCTFLKSLWERHTCCCVGWWMKKG